MKLAAIGIFCAGISGLAARPATDADIHLILREMDKRFEQVDKRIEQIEKRFEQIGKRFEQVDKRFEFLQMLLLALLAATIGSPFLLDFFARRREHAHRDAAMKTEKLYVVLRELAQRDSKVEKALHVAGLS